VIVLGDYNFVLPFLYYTLTLQRRLSVIPAAYYSVFITK